jgi:PPK2 family polyphosphate:nucleotide phosphotransferase
MAFKNLSDISCDAPDNYSLSKEEAKAKTANNAQKIAKLLHVLYAQKKYALLVVLQGMDGSGKDGVTQDIFGATFPGITRVVPFKKPTEEELAHDFLWRVHKSTPAKGEVVIFNRSHYEDILIQRVHKWIDENKVAKRMEAINSFEEQLEFDNNTIILKFYLHLSKDRQLMKLQERIDDPEKQWKHNDGDWAEHELWDEYMKCYEYAIKQSKIPWYVIPADQQWYRDVLVSEIVLEKLQNLDLDYPKLDSEKFK